MPNWMSYIYCEKCDRPLRKNEYRRVEISRGGNHHILYYCKLCNTRGRKLHSILGFNLLNLVGWFFTVFVICLASRHYFVRQVWDYDPTAIEFCLLILVCLMPIVCGRWQKSKCKPIYDRWVHQHGTDPDKWPGLYGRKSFLLLDTQGPVCQAAANLYKI